MRIFVMGHLWAPRGSGACGGDSWPQLLLDEPADLSIVEFHPQKLSFIYGMISGNEIRRSSP